MKWNRQDVPCTWCSTIVSRPLSQIRTTIFCSETHRGLWLRTQRGPAAGGWRGGSVLKICSQCEKPYRVPRNRANISTCCSLQYNGLRGRARIGSLAGNWRGLGSDGRRLKARLGDAARRASYRAGSVTNDEWLTLCGGCGNRCLSCGTTGPLTPDHVVPLSRGGIHSITNLQPLCLACNMRKHTKTIDYRHEGTGVRG